MTSDTTFNLALNEKAKTKTKRCLLMAQKILNKKGHGKA